jgi:MoaA/NifB/PqqE/SkfB family radical SAM enzyme
MSAWVKIYNSGRLSIDLEPTTRCNARCPQCARNDERNNLKQRPWLPMNSISIDQFKEWFPRDVIGNIKNIHMSGTYGDAGMCKDLYKIAQYIMTWGIGTTLSVNTNGGMRDEQFWWDLGVLCGKRLRMIFDIDGINQEMHGFYRRGISLDKVLSNMKTMSYTNAKIHTFTVLFKHNQDYLEQIKDMCRENGAIFCDHVESDRFKETPYFEFIDENGKKQLLEQTTKEEVMIGSFDRVGRRVRDHRHEEMKSEYKSIKCVYAENNSIKISAEGLISPCCYLGTPLENGPWQDTYYNINAWKKNLMASNATKKEDPLHHLMKRYIDNADSFTLSNRGFVDIISDPWWDELEETWNNLDSAPVACVTTCGEKGCKPKTRPRVIAYG